MLIAQSYFLGNLFWGMLAVIVILLVVVRGPITFADPKNWDPTLGRQLSADEVRLKKSEFLPRTEGPEKVQEYKHCKCGAFELVQWYGQDPKDPEPIFTCAKCGVRRREIRPWERRSSQALVHKY
ncbi:MAG: hypothetical protein HYZ63_03460 [Candidatus Andersenbacteria bacterium]|nr:hypothetical protein [Candidatus Andersenbacteria bacterium]